MVFDLLTKVGGDDEMEAIFSKTSVLEDWLEVEAALAYGLAAAGIIDEATAARIEKACRSDAVDDTRLWDEMAVVGYPIFPLVRMICDSLDNDSARYVHFGATTQDIMDTALALELKGAGNRLLELVDEFGDALAVLVDMHKDTVMAGRTHGQQAVPTTFGAKCAIFLDELARHRHRLLVATAETAVVSMFGAGGTSAALGDKASLVRAEVARRLQLNLTEVPWHVARDRPTAVILAASMASTTCARFAREVVDLARTEVAEVAEADGEYRGASSTMPQKANPVLSELALGYAVTGQSVAAAMLRAAEPGHERAAGEWHVEWFAIPHAFSAFAGALRAASQVARGLQVFPERMAANLNVDGGRLMAEAYMIELVAELGRERAHETVYQAVRRLRGSELTLRSELQAGLPESVWERVSPRLPLPQEYLGEAAHICDTALDRWRHRGEVDGPKHDHERNVM